MPRPTKINELLWLLSFYKDGLTWTQLLEKHIGSFVENGEGIQEVICFPAPTLDRLLKKLIKNGIVEKTYVRSGKKGRPMGKYKLTGKYWDPNALFGGTMPNMVRDEEGELFLTRTRRDYSRRAEKIRLLGGPKNIAQTVIVGPYFDNVSSVMGDRGIKLNPYKEKFSPQGKGTGLTPQKKNCRRCGKPVHFVLGTNELCPDCLESPKESLEP